MNDNEKVELKKNILQQKIFDDLLKKTFHSIDLDNSGNIEKNEFKNLLTEIYKMLELPKPTDNDVEREFKRLDKNNDRKLSKEELSVLIKEIIEYLIDNEK